MADRTDLLPGALLPIPYLLDLLRSRTLFVPEAGLRAAPVLLSTLFRFQLG